jgi:hypothetical protein
MGWRAIALAGAVAAVAVVPVAQSAELDAAEVAYRTNLAARYIASVQQVDGMFGYEYDFVSGKFLDRDNIVRQTGAGFGIAEYLKASGDQAFVEPVQRALTAFGSHSIATGTGKAVSPDAKPANARTGATALALLTELFYFEQTRDNRFADLRQAWLDGLRSMQLESGGFAENPEAKTESPYFNGETWLALAHYVRLFPDDAAARDALARAESYLIGHYTNSPDLAFFHWGMLAAAVRYETTREPRFIEYISMQGWLFVFYLRPDLNPQTNACYSVEGLAAGARALRLADRTNDLAYAPTVDRIERELANAFEMQIMPGQMSMALGGGRYLVDSEMDARAGAFLNGRGKPQTRIDFTQHCLSAMMKYTALRAPLEAGR